MQGLLRRLLPALASGLLLATAALTLAQGDGQFCVRSWEDRNGNGSLDPGEPLLTAGVGAELQDAEGLVIASAILDGSPTAAQGVICFRFLQSGEYTLVVNSVGRDASAPTRFTQRIEADGLPVLVDYGTPLLPAPMPAAQSGAAAGLTRELGRIGLALLCAALMTGVMSVTGVLIWFFVLRRRPSGLSPRRR